MTASSAKPIGMLHAVRDREVEADQDRLDDDRAGETPGERRGRLLKRRERGGQPLEPLVHPLGVQDAQRLQQPGERLRHQQRRRRDHRRHAEARPQHARADRTDRRRAAARRDAPSAAISTSPSSPSPRSISTTVVASVFEPAAGAVSAMRMTSPPMLLGRKLLKNVATRNDDVRLAER